MFVNGKYKLDMNKW